MSHRKSHPKPSARERTWRRYRERHDISTPQDEAHFRHFAEIKNQILEWFGRKEPEIKIIPKTGGQR